ncbi:iron ABC transporter permease [Terrarubrum flagellatum]|uniref:ABC transporter permease n=1 Tax=Terrirubrum flagellatum TaxID=2895980 RepID=UPI0031451A09
MPFFYALMRASEAGWQGVLSELMRPMTRELLANTLILATSVTIASGVMAIAAAWCTERCDLPARGFLRVIASLPLSLPAFVSSYAWASLGPWFQGMAGAILILSLASMPLIYLPMAAALRGMDPAFEEVARGLGGGRWRILLRIVLPQAAPALGGGALLVSSHMLAEFGALSFLSVQTFTTAIFQQYDLQFDNASAALLSSVLMALCLPLAFGELYLRKGRRRARVARGNARQPAPAKLSTLQKIIALAGFTLFAALSVGVPFVTMLYWLIQGTSIGQGVERLWPALMGSLAYSLPGGLLITLLALPLVLASMRASGLFVVLAERLPYLVHGLPGLVIALALIYVAIRHAPMLYQTPALVFAAYVMLFLPLAQSAIRASAELIPPELEDVARSLGKGPITAFLRVTLPALASGLGASLAMVVLQLMRELTATLLLAPSGVTTLATEFWSYTNDRAYAAAAPFAALLVLASGLPVYIFTVRSLPKS